MRRASSTRAFAPNSRCTWGPWAGRARRGEVWKWIALSVFFAACQQARSIHPPPIVPSDLSGWSYDLAPPAALDGNALPLDGGTGFGYLSLSAIDHNSQLPV